MQDAPEADRQAPRRIRDHAQGHKGIRLQIWMQPDQLARLEAAAELHGRSRAGEIRDLIDGIKRPAHDCKQAVAALGRVGGLIKHYQAASPADIAQIWDAIRDIRRAIYGG